MLYNAEFHLYTQRATSVGTHDKRGRSPPAAVVVLTKVGKRGQANVDHFQTRTTTPGIKAVGDGAVLFTTVDYSGEISSCREAAIDADRRKHGMADLHTASNSLIDTVGEVKLLQHPRHRKVERKEIPASIACQCVVSERPFLQVRTPTTSKLSISLPMHLHPSVRSPSAS
jgi:hypothetical protein